MKVEKKKWGKNINKGKSNGAKKIKKIDGIDWTAWGH